MSPQLVMTTSGSALWSFLAQFYIPTPLRRMLETRTEHFGRFLWVGRAGWHSVRPRPRVNRTPRTNFVASPKRRENLPHRMTDDAVRCEPFDLKASSRPRISSYASGSPSTEARNRASPRRQSNPLNATRCLGVAEIFADQRRSQ